MQDVPQRGGGKKLLSPDALFEQYANWARAIANKMSQKLTADMQRVAENTALIGLHDAVRRFDPTRGWRFKTYATQRVVGQLMDWQRSECWINSRQRQRWDLSGKRQIEIMPFALDSDGQEVVLEDRRTVDPYRQAAADLIQRILRALPARGGMRHAFKRYYCDDISMKEIGTELNRSESRVCQIVKQALEIAEKFRPQYTA